MTKESKRILKYIDKIEKKLKKQIASLAKRVASIVFDYYADNLTIKNGVISSSTSNLVLAKKIEDLKKKIIKNEINPLMKNVGKELVKIHNLNLDQFKNMPDLKRSAVVASHTKISKKLLERYGFDIAKETIIKDGFLFEAAQMDDVFKKVKVEALRSVINKVPITQFRDRVQKYAVKDKGIEKHFRRISTNVYSQFQRASANQTRTDLGLSFALVSGGIIETTREFCHLRNDKVFHISEILKFGTSADTYGGYTDKSNGDFNGRNKNKTYDPIEDLGDENCRHMYEWISNQMAIRRRPDAVSFLN